MLRIIRQAFEQLEAAFDFAEVSRGQFGICRLVKISTSNLVFLIGPWDLRAQIDWLFGSFLNVQLWQLNFLVRDGQAPRYSSGADH
jgi:hypothetical protein